MPDNAYSCNPVEMRFLINFNRNVTTGGEFSVATNGITNGPCVNATDGYDIDSILTPNTDKFRVSYFEGTYAHSYADSRLRFVITGSDIDLTKTYEVLVDRRNGLRRSCSANTTWIVTVSPLGLQPGPAGALDLVETFPKKCYHYLTQLNFSLPHPQFFTDINLTLRLAYEVTPETEITIHLPGFSNARGAFPLNILEENATQLVGNGADASLVNLTFSTNFTWGGYWLEGDYSDLFQDSRVVLNALGVQPFNELFWINIGKGNHILSTRGHPPNSPELQVSTNSITLYSNRTSVDRAPAIGPLCDALNKCSGHGTCNFATSSCECTDGFGSERDRIRVIADDFAPDCSSRACPIGPSLASFIEHDVFRQNSSEFHIHRDMECSSSGLCNRRTGRCECFPGFTGGACEKMKCAGTPQCSGRGRCLSMQRLAREPDALPLSNQQVTYRGDTENSSFPFNTWDRLLGHTCVCDSSWPVGLAANETQQAEFFGPACQFRRCPSGDDPNTLTVDETDCEGVNLTGTVYAHRDVGEPGNKCHVDCSNRGTCDFNTGVCKCLSGYGGVNCGLLVP